MRDAAGMCLEEDGAELAAGAVREIVPALLAAIADLPQEEAGLRLAGVPALGRFLTASGALWALATRRLGPACRPVRALLFDKSAANNWALGWHQDRVICVAERREVAGFGPWTVKQGMHHVAPPFEVLAGMITLRAHLDDVPATNAPLLVAPGSHRWGVAEDQIEETVRACGTRACIAEAGDVWGYATPVLHSSDRAVQPRRRRVLQVDYATGDLPGGLRWLGI